MGKDIRLWAQTCDACQRNKTPKHQTHIGKFPQPSRRFAHIHVDSVGPLPQSEGYRYLFTITDQATGWPCTSEAGVSNILSNKGGLHCLYRDTYIPKSLQPTDYVFVRQDLVKPALSPP